MIRKVKIKTWEGLKEAGRINDDDDDEIFPPLDSMFDLIFKIEMDNELPLDRIIEIENDGFWGTGASSQDFYFIEEWMIEPEQIITKEETKMSEEKKMSEPEYRKAKGLNYSALSQFFQSQDHALLPFKHKSYFEEGKMFETMLQDACIGTEDFAAKYFLCEVDGKMPDDLISLIESGADLNGEYEYNKDGVTLNGKKKTRHSYLDACLKHEKGLFPVSTATNNMLLQLVDNCLRMDLHGATVFDILKSAEWQVPIFWEKNGIKKKALLDCVFRDGDKTYAFDIKTAANEFQFSQMSQKKYWVQSQHYSEGIEEVYGGLQCFDFLVAFKELPFLCQPFSLEGDRGFEYDKLCRDYLAWLRDGRPPKGYLPHKKIYLRSI